jgi:hypothetical protein
MLVVVVVASSQELGRDQLDCRGHYDHHHHWWFSIFCFFVAHRVSFEIF